MTKTLLAQGLVRQRVWFAMFAAVAATGSARPVYAQIPPRTTAALDGAPALAAVLFPVPESLRPAMRFWHELFTIHTSDRMVIHDRENMDVIWGVVELPKDEDGAVVETAVDKTVRAAVAGIRERLKRLAADPTASDDEDRILLTLAGGAQDRLHGAWERLRTQRGVADRFREGMTRSRELVDSIRQVLLQEGVPVDVAVLPFVESMFNPSARSYAGAVGLWQLMPGTARGFGLKIKGRDDERLDVLKATHAAARVLRQNYRMLGSWPLAITAYNYGPYGLKRAVDRIGSTDLATLISQNEDAAWGFAAKNFYAEFLTMLDVVGEAMAAPENAVSYRD